MKRILAVTLLAVMVLTLCTGCGGASTDMSSSGAGYAPPQSTYDRDWSASPEAAAADMYEYDGEAYDSSDDIGAALPTFLDPDNDIGVRLVYTVEMTLQTTAFPEGTRKLLETVEEVGGFVRSTYVEGRSLRTPDTERYARYTLSIPTGELAGFLVRMEDDYNLVRLSQSSRDITTRHTGSNQQLELLRQQEESLTAALDRLADDEEELRLELEDALYDVRRQINTLSVSVDAMDIDIRYSTVTVELYEVMHLELLFAGDDDVPFGSRVQETAGDSLASFIAFWQGVVLWLLAAWPALLVLLILAGVAFVLWRVLGRPGSRPKKNSHTTSPQNQTPHGEAHPHNNDEQH